MNSQEVSNTLNAVGKLASAAEAMSPFGWYVLGRVTEAVAPKMNAQETANALNALSKLPAAAAATSSSGWDALARATERTAGARYFESRFESRFDPYAVLESRRMVPTRQKGCFEHGFRIPFQNLHSNVCHYGAVRDMNAQEAGSSTVRSSHIRSYTLTRPLQRERGFFFNLPQRKKKRATL